MTEGFFNVYGDEERAAAYADLEFPGTYYLPFRDLPDPFSRHVRGHTALDFGCGTGRSTRFLKRLGFNVLGVDIAQAMLTHAKDRDPEGEYLRLGEGDLGPLSANRFDLVFSAFTFDNIPSAGSRVALLTGLAVIDASTAMEGNGPTGGPLVPMNLIIAGTSPMAADMVAASVMGFDTGEIPTFEWAHRTGLGPTTLDEIEIRGVGLRDARPPLVRPDVIPWTSISQDWGVKVLGSEAPAGRGACPLHSAH
jgi:SAM-dependent methyltransferase